MYRCSHSSLFVAAFRRDQLLAHRATSCSRVRAPVIMRMSLGLSGDDDNIRVRSGAAGANAAKRGGSEWGKGHRRMHMDRRMLNRDDT